MDQRIIEMQSELNADFDHKLGMYSALDPIQEMAYDNECSYEEMIDWMNRERTPQPIVVVECDPNVPF